MITEDMTQSVTEVYYAYVSYTSGSTHYFGVGMGYVYSPEEMKPKWGFKTIENAQKKAHKIFKRMKQNSVDCGVIKVRSEILYARSTLKKITSE